MVSELKDYIRCYDSVVDEAFCKNVIRTFDLDIENQEYLDEAKRPSFTQLNITQQYLNKDEKWINIQAKLQKIVSDYVEVYMKDLDLGPDFPSKYTFEQYRMKKYNPKYDEFKDHVDVGDYNSARRFLVCFLYLNTVQVGGETDFPKINYSIQPKCGRLLMFPSTWMYRHAGRPLPSGQKYIVGTYLHYL